MGRLIVEPNLADPDGTYAALIAAHDGLDRAESAALNARLILILANHLGDPEVLDAALALARAAGRRAGDGAQDAAGDAQGGGAADAEPGP